ncbi:MAG: ComEC/Rec2 family competence protein, partial [Gemmatimonadales bacterium]
MNVRPVVPVLLSYWAGLATGLLRFGDTVPVILASALAMLLLRGRTAMLVAGALAMGRVGAEVAVWRAESSCGKRLPAASFKITGRLRDPAESRSGMVEIIPLGAGCHGSVRARWPRDHEGVAGSEWKISGRWVPPRSPGRGGILIVAGAEFMRDAGGIVDRLRTRLHYSSRSLFGSQSRFVDALVLNRRGDLSRETRETWARAGVVHLLSISGFHVGIIAAWCMLLLRLGGLRGHVTFAAGTAVAAGYVAFIGWPAPAIRAIAFLGLASWCRWRQRRVQPAATLAVAALILMTISPGAATDLGAALSVSAMWGTMHFGRWAIRHWPRSPIRQMAAASAGATLATAPVTAAALGTVAPVGVLVNLVAIPLSGLAIPAVFASLVLDATLPGMAAPMAAAGGALLAILDLLAHWAAQVPFGHVIQVPGPGAALPWMFLLLIAVWGTHRRTPAGLTAVRWSMGAAILAWAWVGGAALGWFTHDRSPVALHFLPAGQGDAALIRTPGGHWILVDAGPGPAEGDAGHRVVLPFLRRRGVTRLAAVILSHAHADHFGGLPAVLEAIPADLVLDPGNLTAEESYLGLLDRLASDGVPWRHARRGMQFRIDGVGFRVLHPDTLWSEWGRDLNEDSIILQLSYGEFDAIFAGDAGFHAEERLAGRVGNVEVLKAGHHGSATATGRRWLGELQPEAA